MPVSLKMDGPGTLPVEGDKPKVLRILQNLLLNAVKYTERGGISVAWGIDPSSDTDRWTFSVQDTGAGIDQDQAAGLAQELHDATGLADEARSASVEGPRDVTAAATARSDSAGTWLHVSRDPPVRVRREVAADRRLRLVDYGSVKMAKFAG